MTTGTSEGSQGSRILESFRRWGYLAADLDPLGRLPPAGPPELAVGGEEAEAARRIYCGTLAVEFMHIPEPDRRNWIAERMEAPAPAVAPAPIPIGVGQAPGGLVLARKMASRELPL